MPKETNKKQSKEKKHFMKDFKAELKRVIWPTTKQLVNNKKSKKEEKNKKHFFKDFKAELKRVVWPTPKQLLNSTIAVITIVLVVGLIVFALDLGLELLNKYGINSLQSKLQDTYSNNSVSNTTSVETNTIDGASSENNTSVE